MKKILLAAGSLIILSLASCGDHTAPASPAGPDSAANNAIVPPSAAPGNATNPSLADTAYHKKDSTKK